MRMSLNFVQVLLFQMIESRIHFKKLKENYSHFAQDFCYNSVTPRTGYPKINHAPKVLEEVGNARANEPYPLKKKKKSQGENTCLTSLKTYKTRRIPFLNGQDRN